MNTVPSAAAEVGRQLPLVAISAYLNFVSVYGAAIVTTLAILYGVMQLCMRYREHRAIMNSNKE